MKKILEILEQDARLSLQEISDRTGYSTDDIKKYILDCEEKGIILKYKTVINNDLIDEQKYVRALIEVSVSPERNTGFDSIAKRIYMFKEVKYCYLLSGTYDLLLIVEDKNIQKVSDFVATKLSPLNGVKRTITHFLLKKYKEDGIIIGLERKDNRLAVTP